VGPDAVCGSIGLRPVQLKKRVTASAARLRFGPPHPLAITRIGGIARCVVKAMPEYHCFFLDAADQVAAILTISCRTDNEARSRADKMLAASDHVGVEIWIGGRRLHRSRKAHYSGGRGDVDDQPSS
jgi:hypothetical protein